MTSECKTLEDIKDNCASSSRTTKKPHEDSNNHNKKPEKPQSKSTDNKEKSKNPLQNQLQAKNQECQNLKSQIVKLQKDLSKKLTKNKRERSISTSSTSTLSPNQTESCMTDIIVEKTRMLKNQELQIEALTQQVNSLKEVISITKDMLDIRNVEVKQLRDKLQCMDVKFGAEKDRHEMVHSKLEKMVKINMELKNEYKKQLFRFSELQKSYHEHVANCKNHLISDKAGTANENFENKVVLVNQPSAEQREVLNEKPLCEEVLELSNETKTENKTEPESQVKESMLKIDATFAKELFVQAKAKGDTDPQEVYAECPITVPSVTESCEQILNEDLNNENIVKGVVEK